MRLCPLLGDNSTGKVRNFFTFGFWSIYMICLFSFLSLLRSRLLLSEDTQKVRLLGFVITSYQTHFLFILQMFFHQTIS